MESYRGLVGQGLAPVAAVLSRRLPHDGTCNDAQRHLPRSGPRYTHRYADRHGNVLQFVYQHPGLQALVFLASWAIPI